MIDNIHSELCVILRNKFKCHYYNQYTCIVVDNKKNKKIRIISNRNEEIR